MAPPATLALALAAVAVGAPHRVHAAPAGAWSNFAPPQGGDGVGCYDSVRHRFIQFDAHHHAWALDAAADSTWTQLTFSGEPPRLTGASAIYDPNGDRMIVFGGIEQNDDLSTGFSTRLWALGFSGTPAWIELHPTGGPPEPRAYHSAVYDPNGKRMIVFGGASQSGPLVKDVWTLSLTGPLAWTQLALPAVGAPAARSRHVAAFDAGRNLMLIEGGASSSSDLKDLWTLTLTGTPTWHFQVTNGLPAPTISDEGAVFDAVSGHMLITGRVTGVPQRVIWEVQFNGSSPTWANTGSHSISGLFPDATVSPTVALDTQRHRLLVNGGGNGRAGLFALNLDAWVWQPVGTPESPGSERWMASVVDPATSNPIRVSNHTYWAFDQSAGGRWRRQAISGPPDDSAFTAAWIVDRQRSRIVTFGGYSAPLGAWFADVRTLQLHGNGGWGAIAASGPGPTPRQGCSAVYDSLRDRMLVYGGSGSGGAADSTVYALSLADGVWSRLAVAGGPPAGRDHDQLMVYDARRDRVLMMLGGLGASDEWQDCWALSLSDPPTWEQLPLTGAPPPSLGRGAAYDVTRDRVVLVGPPDSHPSAGTGGRIDALNLGGSPEWVSLVAHTEPMGPDLPALFGLDAAGDRLIAAPTLWEFPFAPVPAATLTCPGDLVWWPGNTQPVAYPVSDPDAPDQFADYTLESERAWPGFPITGSVLVPAGGGDVSVPVPVPDTALDGLNGLHMHVTLRTTRAVLDCTHHLHDAVTAALGTMSELELLADGVALTWQAPGASGHRAIVERSDDGTSWTSLGDAAEVGNGVFRFADHDAQRGATYSYRLVSDHYVAWTAVALVTIPAQASFALSLQSANPGSTGWAVAVELPGAGVAQLSLYDVAGRRVESHDVRRETSGRTIVTLGAGTRIEPGVYTVVARFGAASMRKRLVLFR